MLKWGAIAAFLLLALVQPSNWCPQNIDTSTCMDVGDVCLLLLGGLFMADRKTNRQTAIRGVPLVSLPDFLDFNFLAPPL